MFVSHNNVLPLILNNEPILEYIQMFIPALNGTIVFLIGTKFSGILIREELWGIPL
jgi:hypothetical protein